MKYAIISFGCTFEACKIIQEFPEYGQSLIENNLYKNLFLYDIEKNVKIIETDFDLSDSDREDIKILCLIDETELTISKLHLRLKQEEEALIKLKAEDIKVIGKGLKW